MSYPALFDLQPAPLWHWRGRCKCTCGPALTCYDSPGFPFRRGKSHLQEAGESGIEYNLTVDQLRAACAGDRVAMSKLFTRLAPPLQRWARGRLPGWARGMVSTVDLVQDALMSTYLVIESGKASDDLAIHAYVRQALKNRLIDQLRKVQRRPRITEMQHSHDSGDASPLEQAIGLEALQRYEDALQRLDDGEREAVLARIELGLPFGEIAGLLGKPSADAARMAVSRALVKLAEAMSHE